MKQCSFSTCFVLINTLILGLAACFSHFAYDLSGRSTLVGLFNPVNESIFEHLKFMFFPNLLWWIVLYFVLKDSCGIDLRRWVTACAVSLAAAPLLVMFLYYTYTQAFGIESVAVDIALAFICYWLALRLALHIYTYSEPGRAAVVLSVAVIALLFIAFILLTLRPPRLPVFRDSITGTYGITASPRPEEAR